MKIEKKGRRLRVSHISELNTANYARFRDSVKAALPASAEALEIDLAQTRFLDSCGLGALFALYKAARARGSQLRLLNPTPPIQQLLELTQMHQLFKIVDEDGDAAAVAVEEAEPAGGVSLQPAES